MYKTHYSMIKTLREEKGYTQQQMADKMGMKNSGEFSKLETGKRKRFDAHLLTKLAEIYEVSPTYILNDGLRTSNDFIDDGNLLSSYIDAIESMLITEHINLSAKYEKNCSYEETDMDYIKSCLEVDHVTREMYEEVAYLVSYVEEEDQYLAFKEMMNNYDTRKLATIFFESLKPKSNPECTHHLYKEWLRYKKERNQNERN